MIRIQVKIPNLRLNHIRWSGSILAVFLSELTKRCRKLPQAGRRGPKCLQFMGFIQRIAKYFFYIQFHQKYAFSLNDMYSRECKKFAIYLDKFLSCARIL